MFRKKNQQGRVSLKKRYLVLVLALAAIALLSVAVGTMAWLKFNRSLLTMTQIQFSTLDLEGQEPDSLPIDLGEIDIRNSGSKEMPFRIRSKPGTQYILQLGHTTNLPLSYEIYPVDEWDGNKSGSLSGRYLNKDSTTSLAESTSREKTYDAQDSVHQNAEPLYWQSTAGACVCSDSGYDYYVLVVSWSGNQDVIDKETEMIYLTAGLGGYTGNETTETTEATE
ncbi:MAG: hypothetical protein ACI3XG_10670 [Faecousia sp.]